MRVLRLAFKRQTALPMLAMMFATGVCLALVLARIFWTGNLRYAFLAWNLFLAWLPLFLALLARDQYRDAPRQTWRFRGLTLGWLLFFPNAPYICTDLIHLTSRFYRHFWVDLVLILCCALTGLVLGFVSLFLMHEVAGHRLGRLASWFFVAGVAGLSGFGIYVGRFLRFNTWDVLFQPLALCREIGRWATTPLGLPNPYAFPVLFGMFLFITYLMLYALTHLQQGLTRRAE